MKMSGMHKSAAILAIICMHVLAAAFLIFSLSEERPIVENFRPSEPVPLRVAARSGFLPSKDAGAKSSIDPKSAESAKEDSSAKPEPAASSHKASDRKDEAAAATPQAPEKPAKAPAPRKAPAVETKPVKQASADAPKATRKVIAATEVSEKGAGVSAKNSSASMPSNPSDKAQKAGKGGAKSALPCIGGGICDASSLAVIIRPDFVYPAAARRRGMQGQVILLLSVGADGKVSSSKVSDSSGFSVLDASAAEYASKMVFDNPSESGIIVRLPVTYKLGQ